MNRRNNAIKLLLATTLALCLISCGVHKPADPMCRQESKSAEMLSNGGSCLFLVDGLLLVLEDRKTGQYYLPGGPKQQQQSTQCAAHQHTWLQTGFNPLVKQHLGDLSADHSVFECVLQNGVDASLSHFAPPAWADNKVRSIQLHDPFVLKPSQWQQYDELIKVRGMFNRASED